MTNCCFVSDVGMKAIACEAVEFVAVLMLYVLTELDIFVLYCQRYPQIKFHFSTV
jgi:hypothetical protein